MPEKQNLSDFDRIGAAVDRAVDAQTSAPPSTSTPPPKKPPRIRPSKVLFGCSVFAGLLFAILILAMIFGLRAGEETIASFGLEAVSLKNWTIGMVSFFFGTLGVVTIIVFFYQITRRLLATKTETALKKQTNRRTLISFVLFTVVMALWYFVYGYISQFQVKPAELPIEIITEPAYTFSLTSPLQVNFSAERITDNFKRTYDLVSYEWDREADGITDATGEKTTLYFPHGNKSRGGSKSNDGVFNVTLLVKLQPKNGEGDLITKEYFKKVSISKQELYGEIGVDHESGEVPLTVKFNANEIKDPHGSPIINYSWDLDDDGRPDRDGLAYQRTEITFDTVGKHRVTLTATSEDLVENGEHEQKTFEKIITVREPEDFVDEDLILEVKPMSGVAPLTVTFSAGDTRKSSQPKIDSYEWLIGDGLAHLRNRQEKFTFEKPGLYPIVLRVTYFNGQVKNKNIEIKVTDSSFAPIAQIVSDPPVSRRYDAVAGPAPLTIYLDGRSSQDNDDNIVQYDWDFDGDGLWDAEGSLVSYQYWDLGEHAVRLRVIDADGNVSTAELRVLIDEEIPIIDFGASQLSGPAPLTVSFDVSGSRLPADREIISYEWNFGDADENTNFLYERAQTAHVFTDVGEYFVNLKLHADDGTTFEEKLKIIATRSSLAAKFSISRATGAAPLAVSFDAAQSAGDIAKVEWNFGDGATSTQTAISHTFSEPGEFVVVLAVYDSFGNVSQTSRTIVAE